MDVIDQANERAENMIQAALAQRTTTRPAPSALWCEDCGEQIPEARRQAAPGCECCISCQELREHRARR